VRNIYVIEAELELIYSKIPLISLFCPKFRCRGNGGRSGVNINDTIRLADTENHIVEPKITILFCT